MHRCQHRAWFRGGLRCGSPVYTELVLIHDAHGDSCEAYLTETLTFDLTPLAEDYRTIVSTTDGFVHTNYGLYVFSDLSCDERVHAAWARINQAESRIDLSCTNASDCVWAGNSTACTASCGVLASAASATALASELEDISSTVCGDFEGDGCSPVIAPPCIAPLTPACVNGACVEGQ